MFRVLALTFAAISVLASAPANLSGKWQLNQKRSSFGSKPVPNKVIVNIEHAEPKYKYSGEVEASDGTVTNFAFDGAIDGREYNLTDSNLTHKMSVKRASDDTIVAQTRYADGKTHEFVTTRITDGGKTLVRTLRVKSPQGTVRWREIYEKMN